DALRHALGEVRRSGAEAMVVPLGVDTFEGDPISTFRLQSADFFRIGQELASVDLPTVFVMEGGYAVAEVGINVVNVLEGFLG
ncbi:MAG: histone deacetylase family protein, partial [Caldimonas sp.]